MSDTVLYDHHDGVAVVTLNRPDALNALTPVMLDALGSALAMASEDVNVRAVLLTGRGRGFCAGADLAGARPDGDLADVGRVLRERYNPVVLALREMPKPVVVAVNGVAAGAGMSLAMAGDVVLAARGASFLQAFAKIGLIPDAGSTWLLPRLVGEQRARALAMLAERIDAETALRLGLVWALHDDAALPEAALVLARHLATQPTQGLALIKQALNASAGHTLREQLDLEATLQARAAGTEDFREGVAAFLGKRAPAFKGR